MVCSTQLSQSPQCALCSVQHTAENKNFFSKSSFYTSNLFFCDRCFFLFGALVSIVRCTPQRRSPQYDAHRRDNLRSVHPIVETMAPGSKKSWLCSIHHWDDLCGVHHTAKSISVVPWCASYGGDNLPGVYHTAKTNCTPQSQNQNLNLSLAAFKETIGRNNFRSEHFYHERKDLKNKMWI